MGCHFFLQGIFLSQGLNPALPHCRQTVYLGREDPLGEGMTTHSSITFTGNKAQQ